jgi:hypothetical protein
MSTLHNHIQNIALAQISYDAIETSIHTIDLEEELSNTLLGVSDTRIAHLVTVYRAVRPLLNAAAVLPIIPPAWRAVLQLFVTTFDEVDETFKAGKDLNPDPAPEEP